MTNRKRVPRRVKRSFKNLSALKKEIDQLRDWAKRNVEVEFIVPLAGGSIKFLGRIIDTAVDDGRIASFLFISQSGVQATLMPHTFGKSWVEKIEGMHCGVYVEGKTKGSQGFSVVESLFQKKPDPDLPNVLEKLRSWERLQLDLYVLLNQRGRAISFLGQVRELSPGIFSFTRVPVLAQLMIRIEEYKDVMLKSEGEKSSIILIDSVTEEMCVISNAEMQPEALFKRFIDLSSAVH